jgi:hypothetical protein
MITENDTELYGWILSSVGSGFIGWSWLQEKKVHASGPTYWFGYLLLLIGNARTAYHSTKTILNSLAVFNNFNEAWLFTLLFLLQTTISYVIMVIVVSWYINRS